MLLIIGTIIAEIIITLVYGLIVWAVYEVVLINWFELTQLPILVWWKYVLIAFIIRVIKSLFN